MILSCCSDQFSLSTTLQVQHVLTCQLLPANSNTTRTAHNYEIDHVPTVCNACVTSSQMANLWTPLVCHSESNRKKITNNNYISIKFKEPTYFICNGIIIHSCLVASQRRLAFCFADNVMQPEAGWWSSKNWDLVCLSESCTSAIVVLWLTQMVSTVSSVDQPGNMHWMTWLPVPLLQPALLLWPRSHMPQGLLWSDDLDPMGGGKSFVVECHSRVF